MLQINIIFVFGLMVHALMLLMYQHWIHQLVNQVHQVHIRGMVKLAKHAQDNQVIQ